MTTAHLAKKERQSHAQQAYKLYSTSSVAHFRDIAGDASADHQDQHQCKDAHAIRAVTPSQGTTSFDGAFFLEGDYPSEFEVTRKASSDSWVDAKYANVSKEPGASQCPEQTAQDKHAKQQKSESSRLQGGSTASVPSTADYQPMMQAAAYGLS